MARNDGIDRILARNQDLETPDDVAKGKRFKKRRPMQNTFFMVGCIGR